MVSKSNEGSASEPIRLNLFVFWSSAISIGIFGLLFVLFPEQSQFWLTYVQGQANQLFGWYYMLVIILCLGFVAWLAFSRVGQIPLGRDDDKPEFGYLAWVSMLFQPESGLPCCITVWLNRWTTFCAPQKGPAVQYRQHAMP